MVSVVFNSVSGQGIIPLVNGQCCFNSISGQGIIHSVSGQCCFNSVSGQGIRSVVKELYP